MKKAEMLRMGGGYAAIVAICALAGVSLFAQTNDNHPVFVAASSGNMPSMKKLVADNPHVVELYDQYGKTPLHYAVSGSNRDLIQYLLEHGASTVARDNRGWTALHWAAANDSDSPQIVDILLCSHADINAINTMRWTPLHEAVYRGHTRVVECLIDHQANPSLLTVDNKSAYNIAVERGNLALKDYLAIHMLVVANDSKARRLSLSTVTK